MRVLWVVNIMMPVAAEAFGEKISNYSGGWLTGGYNALVRDANISLGIAFPHKEVKQTENSEKVCFYTFLEKKNTETMVDRAKEIIESYSPDIIHIYGTEFLHSYVFQNAANELSIPTVISIQGLVSEYAKHFYSDLPYHVIYGLTLRNIVFKDNVFFLKRALQKKGQYEIECIKNAKNVIGRTIWDRACVKAINTNIQYYHNEETLRDSFYEETWDYNKAEKNTLFISQCSSPVKGFHIFLQALAIVKKEIPDIKVFVVGKNILDRRDIKERLNKTYYMEYCRKLIQKKSLGNNIIFLGRLSEHEMVSAMKKANIFVLPSTIENSPNSLCEAMILGVPCIASYVGGVPTLAKEDAVATYQYNSVNVLAHMIVSLLTDNEKQLELSSKAKAVARIRHDRDNNAEVLKKIYYKICGLS